MQWILAARPKTLILALSPVVLGAVFALSHERTEWFLLPFILLSAIMIQVGTNYINDAVDYVKGADTTERLGPPRMALASGSAEKVFSAGILCFIFALIAAIPLIIFGSWPILVIGLTSFLLGYSYTAGPFPLAYLGIGEPFVVLYFGLIPVATTVYLLTGYFGVTEVICGIQMGLLATTLLIMNNLRDVNQDRKADKKTFVVRFGEKAGYLQYLSFHLLPFVIGLLFTLKQQFLMAGLPMLLLPLYLFQAKGVKESIGKSSMNRRLGKQAALQLGFVLMLGVAHVLQ